MKTTNMFLNFGGKWDSKKTKHLSRPSVLFRKEEKKYRKCNVILDRYFKIVEEKMPPKLKPHF